MALFLYAESGVAQEPDVQFCTVCRKQKAGKEKRI